MKLDRTRLANRDSGVRGMKAREYAHLGSDDHTVNGVDRPLADSARSAEPRIAWDAYRPSAIAARSMQDSAAAQAVRRWKFLMEDLNMSNRTSSNAVSSVFGALGVLLATPALALSISTSNVNTVVVDAYKPARAESPSRRVVSAVPLTRSRR